MEEHWNESPEDIAKNPDKKKIAKQRMLESSRCEIRSAGRGIY
jgi:hypothetical protein